MNFLFFLHASYLHAISSGCAGGAVDIVSVCEIGKTCSISSQVHYFNLRGNNIRKCMDPTRSPSYRLISSHIEAVIEAGFIE